MFQCNLSFFRFSNDRPGHPVRERPGPKTFPGRPHNNVRIILIVVVVIVIVVAVAVVVVVMVLLLERL